MYRFLHFTVYGSPSEPLSQFRGWSPKRPTGRMLGNVRRFSVPKRAFALWTPAEQAARCSSPWCPGVKGTLTYLFCLASVTAPVFLCSTQIPHPAVSRKLSIALPPHLLMAWSGPSQLLDGTPFKLTPPISIALILFLMLSSLFLLPHLTLSLSVLPSRSFASPYSSLWSTFLLLPGLVLQILQTNGFRTSDHLRVTWGGDTFFFFF